MDRYAPPVLYGGETLPFRLHGYRLLIRASRSPIGQSVNEEPSETRNTPENCSCSRSKKAKDHQPPQHCVQYHGGSNRTGSPANHSQENTPPVEHEHADDPSFQAAIAFVEIQQEMTETEEYRRDEDSQPSAAASLELGLHPATEHHFLSSDRHNPECDYPGKEEQEFRGFERLPVVAVAVAAGNSAVTPAAQSSVIPSSPTPQLTFFQFSRRQATSLRKESPRCLSHQTGSVRAISAG